jgi:hypothetical protein
MSVIVRWSATMSADKWELEIIAIEQPDCRLVIHVMPMHYRRTR